MKNIDIIKAAQHVDDKYVSEAIDFAPIPKHSFKWGYIAAAACAALAITAVPLIAKYKLAPGNSESNSGNAPVIAATRFDDYDMPRTFYNTGDINEDKIPVKSSTRIYLSTALTECMSRPHDPNDLFAVQVQEYTGASFETIRNKFADDYDRDYSFWRTNGEGAIYMTEEEIRNLEEPSDLILGLSLAPKKYFTQEIDADTLQYELFNKMYAEIQLDYNYDKAVGNGIRGMTQSGDEVLTIDGKEKVVQYINNFTADYGIDAQLIYSNNIGSYDGIINGTLYGEFDTETIGKMLEDERVLSVKRSNGGGYVYEYHGSYHPVYMVGEKQLEKIQAGVTYSEILNRLGDPLQSRYYVTEDARLMILDYDDANDICALSGKELYDSAIPLIFTDECPKTVDKNMVYGIISKNGLFIRLRSDGYVGADSFLSKSGEGCEIIHADGTPASDEELHHPDIRVFAYWEYELMSYPSRCQCTKIVILDD